MIKLKLKLIFILLLSSCVYDPQQKGKDVIIHNQTDKALIISNFLTQDNLRLYDTTVVNNRRYISMQPNYINKYGVYPRFYSDIEMDNLKNKENNKITFYISDPVVLRNTLKNAPIGKSLRLIEISVDTLKKYDLNHLFIFNDTVFLEHKYSQK